MKRLCCLIIAVIMILLLIGCSNTPNDSGNPLQSTDNTLIRNETKILVAYFSCTGTTEKVAEKIADKTNGTLYKIMPQTPYTSEDLNYGNPNSRTSIEQNDENFRTEIAGKIENFEDFDVIFIGYPIWWGKAPKIIYTFLEEYDFGGKTVIPFCTSGSSGIDSSIPILKTITPNATFLDGKRFSSQVSDEDIAKWINDLNIMKNKDTLYIKIGENILEAELTENSSAAALAELLKDKDITIEMHDYGDFEKVGEIGTNLPVNDERITTTAGDLILYQGNKFVIYYDTNSWNFTRLGKIKNISETELKNILGENNVTVTLTLNLSK